MGGHFSRMSPAPAPQRLTITFPESSAEDFETIWATIKGALTRHGLSDGCIKVEEVTPQQLIHAARNIYGHDNLRVDLDASLQRTDDPENDGLWVQAWVKLEDWPRPVTLQRIRRLLDHVAEPGDIEAWQLLTYLRKEQEGLPSLDDETLSERLKMLIDLL